MIDEVIGGDDFLTHFGVQKVINFLICHCDALVHISPLQFLHGELLADLLAGL